MVARQQSLQIDHVPSRLNAIRPNKPRLVRHRITSLYSEMNHECTQTANSFTRSKAGTHAVSLRLGDGANCLGNNKRRWLWAPGVRRDDIDGLLPQALPSAA